MINAVLRFFGSTYRFTKVIEGQSFTIWGHSEGDTSDEFMHDEFMQLLEKNKHKILRILTKGEDD